ncbi:serine aminopeptidase domain-containing protein [Piscinibacter sp. HJYY11]|uniref:serine aminopeptidase domain-containing protein n=1 Tax=Piscinibacter sp. HJYY11 TaxID=2801333 RepID=UPI001F32B7D6|nr:alpha/beta hydrolase [Piscinibacter sp. HJYY11]
MNLRKRVLMLAAVVLGLTLAGCANNRPTVVPMRTLAEPASCGPVETLVVMLPGSYSLPEEFQREGFVRTLREQRVAADVVLVDAHVGYYQERTIIDRLHADVIQPARARGVKHVWVVGISIGAVGAMLYADEHPQGLEGVVLLAPFLGTRLTALEIENAGGLARWPAPERRVDEEIDMRLWRWLQKQTLSPRVPPLHIVQGYGVDDRFAYNNRLLSRSLPPAQVYTAPGGHDWPAWNDLWRRIARELPLPRQAACGPQLTPPAPRP